MMLSAPATWADQGPQIRANHSMFTSSTKSPNDLRVAVLDSGLIRDSENALAEELAERDSEAGKKVAAALQEVDADVVLLTNFDVDPERKSITHFANNYLAVSTEDHEGLAYPYHFTDTVNAGVDSGADLNKDGVIGGPEDSFGYGEFEGQGSMVIFSKHPLEEDEIRTFTQMQWQDMPDAHIPGHFNQLERSILRLSSVAHWDIPIRTETGTIHVLASAPAPREDNTEAGQRVADEISFWEDYVSGADYMTDDDGHGGGVESENFVIVGSMGGDPEGVNDQSEALKSLLGSENIMDPKPEADPSAKPGGVRTDYVLPSSKLDISRSGVLNTECLDESPLSNPSTLLQRLTNSATSEHHLVWTDLELSRD